MAAVPSDAADATKATTVPPPPPKADAAVAKGDEDSDSDGDDAAAAPGDAKKLSKGAKKRLKAKLAKQKQVEAAIASIDGSAGAAAAAAAPSAPAADDDPANPYPVVKRGKVRQTFPEPTVPVRKQFDPVDYPKGVISEHPLEINAYRITSEEKMAMERATESMVFDLRRAAEVHRQVRSWVHTWIKPGLPLMTIADRLEAKLEQLIEKDGLASGQAFPTGLSVNHVAAHYTPNTGDRWILEQDDVLKIDFGTHVNGHIIDSAWTVAFNPKYNPLLEAVRAATNEGIKQAGIDVRLGDIGAAIQEVMESYEVEINGKVHRVKSIRNLSGHSIDTYIIHGGKSVPIVKGHDAVKMVEGELYAIETFGSTGKGYVNEEMECSHYAMTRNAGTIPVRSDKARALLKHIEKTFGTLPFCRKWLDRTGQDRHLINLNALVEAGAVNKYPPLLDIKGSYTAQFEHTFLLKPTAKEVLSRGTDY